MNERTIDMIAQETAEDILRRHAQDFLQRIGLRDAIARLARQGIESSIHLYQMRQRQQAE